MSKMRAGRSVGDLMSELDDEVQNSSTGPKSLVSESTEQGYVEAYARVVKWRLDEERALKEVGSLLQCGRGSHFSAVDPGGGPQRDRILLRSDAAN